jgi:hypothetical protein
LAQILRERAAEVIIDLEDWFQRIANVHKGLVDGIPPVTSSGSTGLVTV